MQNSPKNFYKKLLGRIGENKSVAYLKKKGYKIIERNYRTLFGEADIIAKSGEYIVFVEVKTRSSNNYGSGKEAVDYRKQEKYKIVASEYLKYKKIDNVSVRFDVIEIENNKINHIIDAFGC